MAKSKKTKKAPKVSVARILGFCLLGLLAIGAVANVIKALPKEEEEPVVEYETGTLTISWSGENTFEVEYYEGMTWAELIEHNEEALNGGICLDEEGYVKYVNEQMNFENYVAIIKTDTDRVFFTGEDVFDISLTYNTSNR